MIVKHLEHSLTHSKCCVPVLNEIKNDSVAINWLSGKFIYRVLVLFSVLNEKKEGALPMDEGPPNKTLVLFMN